MRGNRDATGSSQKRLCETCGQQVWVAKSTIVTVVRKFGSMSAVRVTCIPCLPARIENKKVSYEGVSPEQREEIDGVLGKRFDA